MAQGTARSFAIVVCVLAVAAEAESNGTATEVPFELFQQHLVVVKGTIAALDGQNLLIDTGTIPSVVDARIARRLQLQSQPSRLVAFGKQAPIQSATVNGFSFGALRSGPVPAMVGDLSYFDRLRIDAIVGLDVLARANFTIDYRRRVLRFEQAPTEAGAPMELAWPFATVRMTIGGQPLRLLIDTGSPDLVLFRTRMPSSVSDTSWKGDKIVNYASGPARLKRLELHRAGLGPWTWDKLPAWTIDRVLDGYPPEVDGVLGVRVLGCEQVRFDFDNGEFGCGR